VTGINAVRLAYIYISVLQWLSCRSYVIGPHSSRVINCQHTDVPCCR